MNISKVLFEHADVKYKSFQSALMPTVPKDKIIGVRTPFLRSFAKSIMNTDEAKSFIASLPHRYYEEDNLHAFLIEQMGDFDEVVNALEVFLPYIDNWATCDSLNPKAFKNNTDRLLPYIYKWLGSDHTYTVRFAIKSLMAYCLENYFDPAHPKILSQIKSDEYYINMAISWYFATALAKQYDSVIGYLENCLLAPWIHSKTVQKALDSFRIAPEKKQYIKSLK